MNQTPYQENFPPCKRYLNTTFLQEQQTLPATIPKAYTHPDTDLWKSVVEDELLSLNANHVYETIQISEGVTPITSKPVFHIQWLKKLSACLHVLH